MIELCIPKPRTFCKYVKYVQDIMDISQSDEHCGNETRTWDKIIDVFHFPYTRKFRKTGLLCMGVIAAMYFFNGIAALTTKDGMHFSCLNLAWRNDLLYLQWLQ